MAVLTSCSKTVYVFTKCPSIERLDEIKSVSIKVNDDGSLDPDNAYKCVTQLKVYKTAYMHYDKQVVELKRKINEIENKQKER